METIRALLNRIRWDREFGLGNFTIGYYDRLENRVILIPLVEVRFDPKDHFSCLLSDASGQPLTIPLHRIREVHRNGELIWRRDTSPSQKAQED